MGAEQLMRFLAAPLSPSRVSRLRELSITNVMPETFGCIQRMLYHYAAQGTLTSFACTYPRDEISPTMIFDLRTLLQVRFLRFEVLLYRLNEETFITALLNKSNLPPNLVRLTLSFDDEEYYFGRERFTHDAGDYQRMDSIIVSSIPTTCYIDIQMKVSIFIRVSRKQEAALRSKALELFPSLHATGKLTLTLDIVVSPYIT
ncbi:hypothetical protein LshimejAT787_0606330 [Lyophyllum shimeji]|uniref:Uncharacterized protein n=1 Tax=Lyophyllum shimeji TaxID=47721 RepID=A0A9P3PPM8_LYOSH|nr:hypothetical protein LshimejAT787_0606330 [Lyophyllum shimeji]